jgi:MoaA/NifB/PqqE/SkfB family radical SAM enzyme
MSDDGVLKAAELENRARMREQKPRVYEKLRKYSEKVRRGESIAIIQFQYDYICNFSCKHCSVSNFILDTKSLRKRQCQNVKSFTFDDVRELSRQGDEMGLANLVITGGEPLIYKDLASLVAAIDPSKWYIAMDTNGWFFDLAKAREVKALGIDKIQISLDGLSAKQHDDFRRKPGSHQKVMRAIEAARAAGLHLNVSTVVWKSRVRSREFREFVAWMDENEIPLYISLAKPVGAYAGKLDEVCNSADIDYIDKLCREYSCFAHWTPSYGLDIGCIAVKRMVSVTRYGEVMPCPYTHISLGNFFQEPLKKIIDRALRIKLFGYGKKETCFIGNIDHEFIHKYLPRYQGRYDGFRAAPFAEVFDADDFVDGVMPVREMPPVS